MIKPVPLPAGTTLRLLEAGDAPALLEAYRRNHDHLATFDPARAESFYTLTVQQSRLETSLERMDAGLLLSTVIERDGQILGTANLNNIIYGALCSAAVGYWVDGGELRQGLATGLVAALCRIADEELGLHRLEASVSPRNVASQGVLAKSGFEEYGRVSRYLYINGSWQDSILTHKILNDRPPAVLP
jgi:ribosomal-protein-alanine N-acetyltransferase